MFDLVLSWIVVVLPTLGSLGLALLDEKIRKDRRLCFGLIGFGIVVSALTWIQMSRATRMAQADQRAAIQDTSRSVSESVSKTVSDALKQQYQTTIADLQRQIGTLQAELARQGKKVDVISGSNVITGKKPIPVQITNSGAEVNLPNMSWTQSTSQGRTTVQFRLDGSDNYLAFLVGCDRPCKVLDGILPPMSQVSTFTTTNPTMAIVRFNTPRSVSGATSGSIYVEATDHLSPVTITLVRLLRESDFPIGYR